MKHHLRHSLAGLLKIGRTIACPKRHSRKPKVLITAPALENLPCVCVLPRDISLIKLSF